MGAVLSLVQVFGQILSGVFRAVGGILTAAINVTIGILTTIIAILTCQPQRQHPNEEKDGPSGGGRALGRGGPFGRGGPLGGGRRAPATQAQAAAAAPPRLEPVASPAPPALAAAPVPPLQPAGSTAQAGLTYRDSVHAEEPPVGPPPPSYSSIERGTVEEPAAAPEKA